MHYPSKRYQQVIFILLSCSLRCSVDTKPSVYIVNPPPSSTCARCSCIVRSSFTSVSPLDLSYRYL